MTLFGIGRRRCVGEILARAEIYLFFIAIFQAFKFARAKTGDILDLSPNSGVIHYPKQFQFKIEERN